MDKREPDTSGDYGYDLVHEEVGRARTPDGGTVSEPGRTSPPPDAGGSDFEYDEAHDF